MTGLSSPVPSAGPSTHDGSSDDAATGGPRTAPAAEAVVGFRPDQLLGFRIGVTADRRSEDLIAALERRGAEVLHAPTLRIVPAQEDDRLIEDTRAVIAARPDTLLVTTAYGMRGWFEAADAAGLGADLVEVLRRTRILVRGPKARGAVRAAGLDDAGMSERETTESLIDRVLAEGSAAPPDGPSLAGHVIAVQLHGFVDHGQLDRLTAAGAAVHTVAPYSWTTPAEPQRVGRLLDAVIAGNLDAVTFTSAPAADALLAAAAQRGLTARLASAFRGDVTAVTVGPVTSAPLHAAGIPSLHPDRFRLGALVRLLCEHLTTERVRRIETRQGLLELRGRSVRIGDHSAALSPSSVAVLRLLIDAGGAVVPKSRLLEALPEANDEHALEVAIGRLRQALGRRDLVATVIKRGYRLDV